MVVGSGVSSVQEASCFASCAKGLLRLETFPDELGLRGFPSTWEAMGLAEVLQQIAGVDRGLKCTF